MNQVEFLIGVGSFLFGVLVTLAVMLAFFQTRIGCKAVHAKAEGDDNLVLAQITAMKAVMDDWMRRNDESRRIQFSMIRALVALIKDLTPDQRKEILNMQG